MTSESRQTALARMGIFGSALCFLALEVLFVTQNSQTIDEPMHLLAGYVALVSGPTRLADHPHPILMNELSALPLVLEARRKSVPFEPDPTLWRSCTARNANANLSCWPLAVDWLYRQPDPEQVVLLSRIPSLVLGACLVVIVGYFAWDLWGPFAAVIAATLAAFEPTLIAHFGLATTDGAATFATCGTLFLLMRYLKATSWIRLAEVAVASGLSLAVKYSVLPVVTFVAVAILTFAIREGRELGNRETLRRVVMRTGGFLVIAILSLSCTYRLNMRPWWEGLRALNSLVGARDQLFFLLGRYSTDGWYSYFAVAMAAKIPVGILSAFFASIFWANRGANWGWAGGGILSAAAVIIIIASVSRFDLGVRYVLPAFPLLIIVASRAATIPFAGGRARRVVALMFVGSTIVSTLRGAPWFLSYFNEAAGGAYGGIRILNDSNLDWGQELIALREWMKHEGIHTVYLGYFGTAPPERWGVSYQALPSFGAVIPEESTRMSLGERREVICISAFTLKGLRLDPRETYSWLETRRPVARLCGGAMLVYDVTEDADAHVRLAQLYDSVGKRELAIAELVRAQRISPRDPAVTNALRDLGVRVGRGYQSMPKSSE